MIDLVVVPRSDGLDEIRVYFENIEEGKGYVTFICWGSAWTAYFGGMGKETIQQFFASCGSDYLINKILDYNWQKTTKRHENYLQRLIEVVQEKLREAGK